MAVSHAKAALARAFSEGHSPAFVPITPSGQSELWQLGDVAFVVPVVPNDAPLAVQGRTQKPRVLRP
jgi:hypothetical protein